MGQKLPKNRVEKVSPNPCINSRGGETVHGLASKAGSIGRLDFTPAPRCANLRLVSSADGHFLLDIEHDRILKLNSVGAEVWRLLAAGDSESQVVGKISQQYQVNEHRVANDVQVLLKQFEQLQVSPAFSSLAERVPAKSRGTAQPSYPWYGQPNVTKPAPRTVTVIWAFIGLLAFDLILRLFSLKVLCRCVEVCPTSRGKFETDIPGKICSAVERATLWYPKQAVCFQRSAVTTCLLRFYGVAARMMIGIRPLPLQAHSWVEISDAVVNDWRPVSQFYHTATSY